MCLAKMRKVCMHQHRHSNFYPGGRWGETYGTQMLVIKSQEVKEKKNH